jgi:hypothetical protein
MDLLADLVGGRGCAADGTVAVGGNNPLSRLVDVVMEGSSGSQVCKTHITPLIATHCVYLQARITTPVLLVYFDVHLLCTTWSVSVVTATCDSYIQYSICVSVLTLKETLLSCVTEATRRTAAAEQRSCRHCKEWCSRPNGG